jgi:hypothetical protein
MAGPNESDSRGSCNQIFRKGDSGRSFDRDMDGTQQIGVRIDADKSRGFTGRIKEGCDLGPAQGAGPVVVLATDDRTAQSTLGGGMPPAGLCRVRPRGRPSAQGDRMRITRPSGIIRVARERRVADRAADTVSKSRRKVSHGRVRVP